MDLISAVVLGILQGVTEFLPVSSSGHLVIAEHLFGLEGTPLSFDVALHMGTLLAVLVYFRKEWLSMAGAMLPGGGGGDRRQAVLLLVGTVPAGAAGFMFEDQVESVLRSPWVVVATLAAVALVIALAEWRAAHSRELGSMTLKDAVAIGAAQALALVPGVSRSGITIAAGLFAGLGRQAAARFSFLLSAPVIAGAGLLEGLKVMEAGGGGVTPGAYAAGFLASSLSGYLVISLFISFLRRHSLYPFVIYRLALAAAVASILVWR